jgi:hypothetical protein
MGVFCLTALNYLIELQLCQVNSLNFTTVQRHDILASGIAYELLCESFSSRRVEFVSLSRSILYVKP